MTNFVPWINKDYLSIYLFVAVAVVVVLTVTSEIRFSATGPRRSRKESLSTGFK